MAKPDFIKTDPERALRDEGFRRGPAAKSIRPDIARGDASLKTLENIRISAICVARRTLTASPSKKCSMNALLNATKCIGIEELLPGSSCWVKYRQTIRFVKSLILFSVVLKLWTRLQSSISERRKSRTKLISRKICHFENDAKKFIKPNVGSTGQHVNGAGTGDLANNASRMKGGVFLGPASR